MSHMAMNAQAKAIHYYTDYTAALRSQEILYKFSSLRVFMQLKAFEECV